MAFNLSDSLNLIAAAPGKNAFSLKKQDIGEAMPADGPSADFSQLLSHLMAPAQPKGVGTTVSAESPQIDPEDTAAPSPTTEPAAVADGSAFMLPVPPPVQPNLTAIVLSPNMTAITPSQPMPDAGSLVAFAQSQGLDKEVAAWLLSAGRNMPAAKPGVANPMPGAGSLQAFARSPGSGKEVAPELLGVGQSSPMVTSGLKSTHSMGNGSTSTSTSTVTATTAASPEAKAPDEAALGPAALAISLLASPMAGAPRQPLASPTAAAAVTDPAASPIPSMPMVPPPAWMVPRMPSPGKTANTTATVPSPPPGSATVHHSDLDLTLVFEADTTASKPPSAPDSGFTPAAWVMAGMGKGPEQAAALTALPQAKLPANDAPVQTDLGNMDMLGGATAERSPAKPGDPLASLTTSQPKATEPTLSSIERSELHQVQAEKLGQAIGQRMLSEMEKGHWHLKMMLKPANLGNVEVEMRLRHGELDASFTASQAATRDLLQDGLPKLRDTLTQLGMDVASMHIGGGSSQKNGGDPTPQQPHNLDARAKPEPKEAPATAQSVQVTSPDQDGLDVLV